MDSGAIVLRNIRRDIPALKPLAAKIICLQKQLIASVQRYQELYAKPEKDEEKLNELLIEILSINEQQNQELLLVRETEQSFNSTDVQDNLYCTEQISNQSTPVKNGDAMEIQTETHNQTVELQITGNEIVDKSFVVNKEEVSSLENRSPYEDEDLHFNQNESTMDWEDLTTECWTQTDRLLQKIENVGSKVCQQDFMAAMDLVHVNQYQHAESLLAKRKLHVSQGKKVTTGPWQLLDVPTKVTNRRCNYLASGLHVTVRQKDPQRSISAAAAEIGVKTRHHDSRGSSRTSSRASSPVSATDLGNRDIMSGTKKPRAIKTRAAKVKRVAKSTGEFTAVPNSTSFIIKPANLISNTSSTSTLDASMPKTIINSEDAISIGKSDSDEPSITCTYENGFPHFTINVPDSSPENVPKPTRVIACGNKNQISRFKEKGNHRTRVPSMPENGHVKVDSLGGLIISTSNPILSNKSIIRSLDPSVSITATTSDSGLKSRRSMPASFPSDDDIGDVVVEKVVKCKETNQSKSIRTILNGNTHTKIEHSSETELAISKAGRSSTCPITVAEISLDRLNRNKEISYSKVNRSSENSYSHIKTEFESGRNNKREHSPSSKSKIVDNQIGDCASIVESGIKSSDGNDTNDRVERPSKSKTSQPRITRTIINGIPHFQVEFPGESGNSSKRSRSPSIDATSETKDSVFTILPIDPTPTEMEESQEVSVSRLSPSENLNNDFASEHTAKLKNNPKLIKRPRMAHNFITLSAKPVQSISTNSTVSKSITALSPQRDDSNSKGNAGYGLDKCDNWIGSPHFKIYRTFPAVSSSSATPTSDWTVMSSSNISTNTTVSKSPNTSVVSKTSPLATGKIVVQSSVKAGSSPSVTGKSPVLSLPTATVNKTSSSVTIPQAKLVPIAPKIPGNMSNFVIVPFAGKGNLQPKLKRPVSLLKSCPTIPKSKPPPGTLLTVKNLKECLQKSSIQYKDMKVVVQKSPLATSANPVVVTTAGQGQSSLKLEDVKKRIKNNCPSPMSSRESNVEDTQTNLTSPTVIVADMSG